MARILGVYPARLNQGSLDRNLGVLDYYREGEAGR